MTIHPFSAADNLRPTEEEMTHSLQDLDLSSTEPLVVFSGTVTSRMSILNSGASSTSVRDTETKAVDSPLYSRPVISGSGLRASIWILMPRIEIRYLNYDQMADAVAVAFHSKKSLVVSGRDVEVDQGAAAVGLIGVRGSDAQHRVSHGSVLCQRGTAVLQDTET
ncbi:hypothetical protein EYF80_014038 [Liparis tanakae]|uniref:Uncharacterized protein n=1 Tax=Liparis tanakae TaxID=230148 RepID=A0A4Z2IDP6_9TELE|nr:hypothetical protein EYF80_014038 [Liparis tanakae]